MNNLYRELAPISDAAWAEIEEETSRTLKRYLAGRRVVDVKGPGGTALSAVGTGHLRTIAAQQDGIVARQREVKALVVDEDFQAHHVGGLVADGVVVHRGVTLRD